MATEQTYTDEGSPLSGSAANSAGLVTSVEDFYRSYKRHDGTGMIVSASAFTANAAGLVLRATKTGQKIIGRIGEMIGVSAGDDGAEIVEGMAKGTNYLETASRIAGPTLAVASVAYQTYKEDGHFVNPDGTIGHKSQCLMGSSFVAGTTLGVGYLLGSGLAPLAGTVVLAYEVNKAKDIAIDTHRISERMDKQTSTFFTPGTTGFKSEQPSFAEYKTLVGAVTTVSKDMRDDQLSAPAARMSSGAIKATDVTRIDMTDPRNLREFEQALAAEVARQDQMAKDNDSILPRWLRHGDSVMKFNDAETALKMLHAAQEELARFKAELANYNQAHHEPTAEVRHPASAHASAPKNARAPASAAAKPKPGQPDPA